MYSYNWLKLTPAFTPIGLRWPKFLPKCPKILIGKQFDMFAADKNVKNGRK